MINFFKKLFFICLIFNSFNLFSVLIENISEKELMDLIEKENFIYIEFYATWCGPCQKMLPIFKSVAEKNPNLYFVTLNIDNNKKLAKEYNAISIPTIICSSKNKKIVWKINGIISKDELNKKIKDTK